MNPHVAAALFFAYKEMPTYNFPTNKGL